MRPKLPQVVFLVGVQLDITARPPAADSAAQAPAEHASEQQPAAGPTAEQPRLNGKADAAHATAEASQEAEEAHAADRDTAEDSNSTGVSQAAGKGVDVVPGEPSGAQLVAQRGVCGAVRVACRSLCPSAGTFVQGRPLPEPPPACTGPFPCMRLLACTGRHARPGA